MTMQTAVPSPAHDDTTLQGGPPHTSATVVSEAATAAGTKTGASTSSSMGCSGGGTSTCMSTSFMHSAQHSGFSTIRPISFGSTMNSSEDDEMLEMDELSFCRPKPHRPTGATSDFTPSAFNASSRTRTPSTFTPTALRMSPFEPLTKDRNYHHATTTGGAGRHRPYFPVPYRLGGKVSPLPTQEEYHAWQKRREEEKTRGMFCANGTGTGTLYNFGKTVNCNGKQNAVPPPPPSASASASSVAEAGAETDTESVPVVNHRAFRPVTVSPLIEIEEKGELEENNRFCSLHRRNNVHNHNGSSHQHQHQHRRHSLVQENDKLRDRIEQLERMLVDQSNSNSNPVRNVDTNNGDGGHALVQQHCHAGVRRKALDRDDSFSTSSSNSSSSPVRRQAQSNNDRRKRVKIES